MATRIRHLDWTPRTGKRESSPGLRDVSHSGESQSPIQTLVRVRTPIQQSIRRIARSANCQYKSRQDTAIRTQTVTFCSGISVDEFVSVAVLYLKLNLPLYPVDARGVHYERSLDGVKPSVADRSNCFGSPVHGDG